MQKDSIPKAKKRVSINKLPELLNVKRDTKRELKKIMTGSLYGFSDIYDSWSAGATMDLEDFKINFSLEATYVVVGRREKTDYYTGIIYRNKEEVGRVYVWVYENELYGVVINGQWVEYGESYQLFGKFGWQK